MVSDHPSYSPKSMVRSYCSWTSHRRDTVHNEWFAGPIVTSHSSVADRDTHFLFIKLLTFNTFHQTFRVCIIHPDISGSIIYLELLFIEITAFDKEYKIYSVAASRSRVITQFFSNCIRLCGRYNVVTTLRM